MTNRCTIKYFENVLKVFGIEFTKCWNRIRNSNHIIFYAEKDRIPDFRITSFSDTSWVVSYCKKFWKEGNSVYK